jgi:hypothetical protein
MCVIDRILIVIRQGGVTTVLLGPSGADQHRLNEAPRGPRENRDVKDHVCVLEDQAELRHVILRLARPRCTGAVRSAAGPRPAGVQVAPTPPGPAARRRPCRPGPGPLPAGAGWGDLTEVIQPQAIPAKGTASFLERQLTPYLLSTWCAAANSRFVP